MSELLKHSFFFAFATMLSRFLGLFRDAAFAHYFGRSGEYDAYLIAILLPFYLRRIFAEGALSSAFIPLFTRKKGDEAQKFFSTTFWATLIATVILYIPILLFSDGIAYIMGTGLSDSLLTLTSNLMKITYPFIIFISLWAVISGVLNTKNIFFIPAIAPALTNILTIIFIFTSSYFFPKILGPTIGFTIGGLAQFLFVWCFLKKTGFKITFDFEKKYINEILNLFGPALLGVAISTFNTVIDTNIATWTGKGGVSTIQYALRLYQLPLGIFGVSIANALLPKLSYAREMKNENDYSKYLRESVILILFFSIPSTFGLIFLSNQIISLIYEHGNFTSADTFITAKTLVFYSIGLPFYSLHGIFVRTYHSDLNTKAPTLISSIMLGINIILDILLAIKFGIYGIALATSISGIVGMFLSSYRSFKYFKIEDLIEILKIIIASLIMSLSLIYSTLIFNSNFGTIIQILIGIFVFFISCTFLKVKYLNKALKIIKLKK
ncbi:murein biosynthesis integral membrane protein MurJ [Oceanotoga sp. DSM 15011]|uniref:murein biosynthesis integral membrane protein MurJ n=1 Tax=unclassified Oceanotoga TaxID=2618448 RepID=UPI0021F49F07|nr:MULTISPECIES: murein biosynthesis integral membrane protein MurJ [unclassified Oceanotoga]MDN5342361.1 putative peptidoglycan lipid flippase [Oceanotoga sp.]UYP00936.1 murein biosynthesis integral membrane protein MurJ [Oceanotoga sp. DSM 15011]